MCLYVRGDVEVHERFTSSNDGKHADFLWTNVFSITVSFPMFCRVSVKLARVVWCSGSLAGESG